LPELVAARSAVIDAAWALANHVRRVGTPTTARPSLASALLSLTALCPGFGTTAELDVAARDVTESALLDNTTPATATQSDATLYELIARLATALDRLAHVRGITTRDTGRARPSPTLSHRYPPAASRRL
jgi:hypothetical protein